MSAPFAGFCVRGLLSVLFSRAMENLTAEINHDFPGSMQVSDHGWWFSYFSNVDWLTQQCRSIHNSNKKIVLIGHSFGATAAIIVTQRLNAMNIPVELLCPVDPAAQYTTVITPHVMRVIGFYQTTPGLLGQGVDREGKGWTDAAWKERTREFHRLDTHLGIANDPFVHDTICSAVKDITNGTA